MLKLKADLSPMLCAGPEAKSGDGGQGHAAGGTDPGEWDLGGDIATLQVTSCKYEATCSLKCCLGFQRYDDYQAASMAYAPSYTVSLHSYRTRLLW